MFTNHLFNERKNGFTLIEVLVALALASICIMVVMTIANLFVQSYRSQERVTDAQQGVRAAMDLLVRDIRMAGYDPMALTNGPSPGIGILVAKDTLFQFSSDINADQVDSGGIENLTYFYEADTQRLRLKEGGPAYPQTFIENVSALKFTYFDANRNPTAVLEEIATVLVTLTVQDFFKKGTTFERSLTTMINCRNIRARQLRDSNFLAME